VLIQKQTAIPSLVRVKPGALDRLGIYIRRQGFERAVLFFSQDLQPHLMQAVIAALEAEDIKVVGRESVQNASFEQAMKLFQDLPAQTEAVIGFGGGKALDVAKYVSFLGKLPYFAVPTSLSNDGFCSPQSSLTMEGRRRSLPAIMPLGVIIDTAVCMGAPEILWHSGVGDLVAKFSAVTDWKLAFHAAGTPVDDFAALLSDASVYQFIARPLRDAEGFKLLGSALLLNGISMSICGSSRPASGSEHLISHALDLTSQRPRLHGLQVGVASYLVSLLQACHRDAIVDLFSATGFWQVIEADPFDRAEWLEAARLAPSLKTDFYTVLSSRDCLPEIASLMDSDPHLKRCFAR
jgi:glycerol-1-phosphate dehydrogenase [NAD(P)+]